MSRLKELVKRQLVDAIFERGMVEGLRIEVNPGKAALVPFQELMPGAGQVLVETRYSAISCGTERAYYLRLDNVVEPYPIVMGYSMVGEVVAAGPECAWALGRVVACPGHHASFHLSPAERTLPVPSDVPLPYAALFNMGVIAQQGVRRARIVPGESVIVLGAGLIGQLAAQLAVLAGAEVTIVATSEARLSVARACGIERTIDATSGLDKLKTVAATVVIDATGRPDAVKQAVLAAADRARVVLLGSSRGTTADIGVAAWAKREVSLRGAHLLTMPQGAASSGLWTWEREARTFLEFSRDRLRLEPLITRQLPPNDVSTLYQTLAAPGDKSVGVVLDWSEPGPWRLRVPRQSPLRPLARMSRRLMGRALPTKASPTPPRPDRRRLRFGLVGCGEIAAESASALRAAANAQIVFAVDPNADLARDIATRSGARHATELGALLDCNEVDAVLISTPHHLHAPLAIECLRAGKHVIVEKPMATTVAECDQMIAAATAAGRHLSVCYCTRFDARVQKAKELLDEGVIGEVLSTHVVWAQHRAKDYWSKGLTGRSEGDWRAHKKTAGGGVLIMNACHVLDMMMWMVGRRVVDAVARTATLVQPVEVEDTVSLTYTYEGGALGTLSASTAHAGPAIHDQRIQGRNGQLSIAPDLQSWSSRPLSGRPADRWVSEGSFEAGLDRRRYFERLADAVLDDRPLPVTGEEARAVQVVIERAYRSTAQGSTL